MKTKSNFIALATIAMMATTGATAYAAQGTTHNNPLSKETTEKYLKEYLGIFNYNNGWYYTGKYSNRTVTPNAPTGTQPGDVLFVEVNDNWKGSEWSASPNHYNQVKYGVKAIHKVNQSTKIGNGDLYHYDATTNRFFFAIRTSDLYTGSNASWSSDGSTRYLTDSKYPMPMRWYNEFSACSNTSVDGWDQLSAAYDDLKDGDFMPAPHSCSNSLEKNHFTTLYGKTSIGQTYSVSAMLFVPSGAKSTTNQKNGSFASGSIPQVFFYINKLTGERIAKTTSVGTSCKYAAQLNWKTSIDKAREKGIDFVTWNSTNGGIKEESHIYRMIEGEDEFTEVWVENGLVDIKNYTDNNLPKPKADGYDVTYYIVTKAITYDKRGQRIGEEIGNAVTNQVTIHIPGSEQFFDLAITNKFNSKYSPVANNIRQSYNLITNDIASKPSEFSPKLSDLKTGDKFELMRIEESTGDKAVNTLVITDIKTTTKYGKTTTTYYYTLNGKSASKAFTSMQDVLDLAAGYRDEVEATPGRQYDTKYQLVYTTTGDELRSNIVTAQSKRTDVQVIKSYRSGTPDPIKDAVEELYSLDVRFKPIMSDDIAHYYIWRNAEERVVRVGQAGTQFTLVGRDENDNFNVDLGPIEPDQDGYITIHVDHSLAKHVCDYEDGHGHALEANDLFFTVEVCTTGGNTYGNYDRPTDFQGDASELVLNSRGTFYAGDNTRPGQYCAEIAWDKIKNEDNLDASDYVAGQPDYYTVHRKRINENNEVSFEPITKFFRGHNDRYDAAGNLIEAGNYELVDETTDGSAYKFTPELIDQVLFETGDPEFYVVDFITDKNFVPTATNVFPAVYYVKAHYESPFTYVGPSFYDDGTDTPVRNYIEKNSNPTHAASIIVTGVEEKHVSEIVSTEYYTLQGVKISNPAHGDIVVAKRHHADGTTSGRVVRM